MVGYWPCSFLRFYYRAAYGKARQSSESKKDNFKVARLDFLVGILPHFQRLLTRNKQR